MGDILGDFLGISAPVRLYPLWDLVSIVAKITCRAGIDMFEGLAHSREDVPSTVL